MSSAAPVAQNPAHEKVNAFGLRSELSDTTAGAHRSFGFSLRASEGVAGPIGVPSITGGGGVASGARRARVNAGLCESRLYSWSKEEKLEMET